MSRIKGFAAILLAAAVLTGCNNGGESSAEISSQTSSSSTSTASSTSTISSATTSVSSVPEIPAAEENVFVMSFDPQDGRKIEFDGLTATISGKIPSEGISYAETDRSADISVKENGDEFTAVISYLSPVF